MPTEIPAHDQRVVHRYTVHYPAHEPREGDPHYALFKAYRERIEGTDRWRCYVGAHHGDFSECDLQHPLELHHAIVEFALINEVDLAAIQQDYPEVKTMEDFERFAESEQALMVLCRYHHRGPAGVHTASYADWRASLYIKGLIRGR